MSLLLILYILGVFSTSILVSYFSSELGDLDGPPTVIFWPIVLALLILIFVFVFLPEEIAKKLKQRKTKLKEETIDNLENLKQENEHLRAELSSLKNYRGK